MPVILLCYIQVKYPFHTPCYLKPESRRINWVIWLKLYEYVVASGFYYRATAVSLHHVRKISFKFSQFSSLVVFTIEKINSIVPKIEGAFKCNERGKGTRPRSFLKICSIVLLKAILLWLHIKGNKVDIQYVSIFRSKMPLAVSIGWITHWIARWVDNYVPRTLIYFYLTWLCIPITSSMWIYNKNCNIE